MGDSNSPSPLYFWGIYRAISANLSTNPFLVHTRMHINLHLSTSGDAQNEAHLVLSHIFWLKEERAVLAFIQEFMKNQVEILEVFWSYFDNFHTDVSTHANFCPRPSSIFRIV